MKRYRSVKLDSQQKAHGKITVAENVDNVSDDLFESEEIFAVAETIE